MTDIDLYLHEKGNMQTGASNARPSNNRRALLSVLVDCAGATVVEFAIVGSLFLLLLIGIIETGRVLWIENVLHYTVQQAARCVSVNQTLCGTQDLMRSFAANIAGSNLSSSVYTLTSPAPACGNQVTATYIVQLNIPFVPMTPTLTASACFPKIS